MNAQETTVNPCGCCQMSRRCFLAASAVAVATPMLGAKVPKGEPGTLGEYVDLADFRPRPSVRVVSAVVRHKPPYWLGWPGTAYDLEGHRLHYAQTFAQAAKRVGIHWEEEPQPLESEEAVNVFAGRVAAERPDAVLISLQHLSAWNWADAVAKAGVPTIIFAPIGTAFTGHVLEISRRQGVYVISSLDTKAVEQAFRMIRAKRQLEETRLLVVAGDKREEKVLERLGTTVKYVPRPTLHELFARMPETEETYEVARQARRHAKKIVEPTRQDLLNAARSFQTAKRLLKDEGCNAITTDCLGMVSARVVPTPPCLAASLFQDGGVTYGCEADVFGAISLMLVSYLFDKPGFMNDPVPETVKNRLIVAHCTCGTRLNGFQEPQEPFVLRSHSESDIGVSLQILWKEGQQATLVRVQNPNELIVDTGTVTSNVDTPPAGGCRTSVELAMDQIEDVRDVRGFHQVVFYGNHRRDVEAFCQLYGIRATHSPEKVSEPVGV